MRTEIRATTATVKILRKPGKVPKRQTKQLQTTAFSFFIFAFSTDSA